MYIDTLQMDNLRCFRTASVHFQHPDRKQDPTPPIRNVNLLLGNNGAGKTTVLKAVALGILSPILEQSGYVPYSLVRRSATEEPPKAEIRVAVRLHSQDVVSEDAAVSASTDLQMTIERIHDTEIMRSQPVGAGSWTNLYNNTSPAFLLVGYGASRRVETSTSFDSGARTKSRLLRYQRVAGLFEEHVTLTPLAAWLPELSTSNPGRYKQVCTLIDRLLPDGIRFEGNLNNGEYHFERYGSSVPFGALSDGYRAFIGWVADLLYHVCMGCPNNTKLVDNRGIVLVDEIDLHLHPEWQRTVVQTLSKALPRLQFIITSHSPIVAGTLQSANIFVMDVDPSGASTVRQLEENVHGLNADQILVSSYFNLNTTRAPDVVDELQQLSRQAWTGDHSAAVEFLKKLARGSEVPPGEPVRVKKPTSKRDNTSQDEQARNSLSTKSRAVKGSDSTKK